MSESVIEWLKKYGVVCTFLSLLIAAFLSPFGLDALVGAYAFLGTALIFALAAWKVWPIPIEDAKWRAVLKGLVFVLIIASAIGLGYFLWWAWQPHFEITALDTLEDDPNAYELTDHLIWNQDNLDKYGVAITFTLEIRPSYYGRQKFGRVVALISGDGGKLPGEKPLWDDFDSRSGTQEIQLTLPELIDASGLKRNSDPPSNPFRPGDLPFQRAKLVLQVARAADKTHPWSTKEITIRNAPWELRSGLVWRNGEREADVYVKNLGGTGGFTVRYRLVRLEKDIDSSPSPEVSGTTYIDAWNEPGNLVYLKKGDFFTDTVSVPNQLTQGRYLLEIYVVKKQNFVQFEDPNTTWENLNSMNSPWWFGEYPSDTHLFVVTTSEFAEDPTIQAEWKRLKDEQGFDLGLAMGPVEEVASGTGTVGLQQVFQEGEIYVHGGQAYAIYGPILEHFRELGGVQYEILGFPVSQIEAVTSSSGVEGYMMEFEGPGSPHDTTAIYASRKGVAALWMWVRGVYTYDNGGHSGWLGFPLADEQYFADSTIQMFEHGYIVYHYPFIGEERDWSRKPVAYPYLASRGTLFDVYADQLWQDTGVQVQTGDQVTIIQVGGAWTNWEPGEVSFDANGDANMDLNENAMLASAFIGVLIGRIGEEDGHVFSVGRWGVITSPSDGTLFLAMNDGYYEDNAGFITVQIMVEPAD